MLSIMNAVYIAIIGILTAWLILDKTQRYFKRKSASDELNSVKRAKLGAITKMLDQCTFVYPIDVDDKANSTWDADVWTKMYGRD
jgi:hypothetical protein